jgi:site-specific DNA-cytosine methylase
VDEAQQTGLGSGCVSMADAAFGRRREHGHERCQTGDAPAGQSAVSGSSLADASGAGLPGAECAGRREPLVTAADIRRSASECRWGRPEPGMGGEDVGFPIRLDTTRPVEAWEGNTPRVVGRGAINRRPRLKALGNSVVPQVVEMIGQAIMRFEARS